MFYQAQKAALEQISRLCSEKQHFTRQIDFLGNEIRAQRDDVMQMKGELKATCRKGAPKMTLPTGKLNINPVIVFKFFFTILFDHVVKGVVVVTWYLIDSVLYIKSNAKS